MRWHRILIVLAGVTAAWCAAPAAVTHAARPAAGGGAWGTAIEVPGSAALNTGGNAMVMSVSCASAGYCAAGGYYYHHGRQAFVVSERNGRWGTAIEVPGSAALNAGSDGFALVTSVSCASPGNCAAGGSYDHAQRSQAFVVSERNGRWGDAEEVPGSAALNTDGFAQVTSVSCASPGSCAAGGFYYYRPGYSEAFVVSERNGRRGTAIEVPGLAALNRGDAQVTSVSCGSAGNCAAGGYYYRHGFQAFVVSERNGRWGKAEEVPGSAALNSGARAGVTSVSCASAGNCVAGGHYRVGAHRRQAFVVSERNGRWGTAIEVPGSAALNTGGSAVVNSVSCTSAGNCAAGGLYRDSRSLQAFVVSEQNGQWGNAEQVPGSATLNQGGGASVASVSCASAGNCAAGGSYVDGSHNLQAFVVSEQNGVWGNAEQVPGSATLNAAGYAQVSSVSCSPAGTCAAGGFYQAILLQNQAFVVSRP